MPLNKLSKEIPFIVQAIDEMMFPTILPRNNINPDLEVSITWINGKKTKNGTLYFEELDHPTNSGKTSSLYFLHNEQERSGATPLQFLAKNLQKKYLYSWILTLPYDYGWKSTFSDRNSIDVDTITIINKTTGKKYILTKEIMADFIQENILKITETKNYIPKILRQKYDSYTQHNTN